MFLQQLQLPKGTLSIINHFSAWCNSVEGSLILLLTLIVLRIPNLAEPYWYGDEAIYLTIGTALRHGVELYAGIVDHKTPLIYYLAMVPSQFWFRVLLIVWMSITTLLFYGVAQKFLSGKKTAFFSSLLFVFLTCWPGLEGNIPNGELFVMGFIIASLWLLTRTHVFSVWRKGENTLRAVSKADAVHIFAAGFVASLGLLTKVPAILDIGALGVLLVMIAIPFTRKSVFNNLKMSALLGSIFTLGVALPIMLSLLYYAVRGNLDAYLQFGLLYNFHYVGTWVPEFSSSIVAFFFTLPGKALVLILGFSALLFSVWKQPQYRVLPWTTFWLLAALFASLLSNRPYPHYFLQLVPPFVLFLAAMLESRKQFFAKGIGVWTVLLIIAAAWFLRFGFYPTISYYERYFQLITQRISPEEYARQFNGILDQNQVIAQDVLAGSTENDRIFVWGTNPMLYAYTQRVPATRFTVAFHIHDLKVYTETLDEIQTQKPAFIVVMRQETTWPELNDYILSHYILSNSTQDMLLYRRTRLSSLLQYGPF